MGAMRAVSILAALSGASAAADWERMCAMFDGQFDNYDQLEDLTCGSQWGGCKNKNETHAPMHSIFKRVDDKANLTGVLKGDGCVLYVEQYGEKDPTKVYRQKLYVISPTLEMSLWSFADAKAVLGAYKNPALLNGIAYPNVYDLKGCDVTWAWNETAKMFKGKTSPTTCAFGKYVITDDNMLSENFVTIHEHWTPPIPGTNKILPDVLYRWRTATLQQYKGFIFAVNPANMSQQTFVSKIPLLNNGQIRRIAIGDMAWWVEVAVCHYSKDHTGAEVLKLAVYREGHTDAMAYTWVAPGTVSMGLTYRDLTASNVIVQMEFKLVGDGEEVEESLQSELVV